jgi:hypothetical protein
MRCPKCNQQFYDAYKPCSICQFSGDSALVEEWSHIGWLLNEQAIWQIIEADTWQRLRQNYTERQKKIEIKLGLRLPPFTREEARQAWTRLVQQETLLKKMERWLEMGLLKPAVSQALVDRSRQQVDEILERMEGHLRSSPPQTEDDQLKLTIILLEAVDELSQKHGFISLEATEQVRAPLLADKERLEIQLGLRPAPAPLPPPKEEPLPQPIVAVKEAERDSEPEDVGQPVISPIAQLAEPEPPAIPEPSLPRPPFRERLWQILLSERTLQGMLFMGIFLLFSAALSFVVWGWKDFSAPLRVAIPTGFTSAFFALGWYVRAKTPMYRSGVALNAIAALLIPIDFYTIYVNFYIPAHYWALFWLGASIACLIAYVLAAILIRSRLFGYMVGLAAGSTALALIEWGHETFALSLDWRSAGLAGVCLVLIALASALTTPRRQEDALTVKRILAGPFRILALFGISIIMALTFVWRFTLRESYDTLHYALTVNWGLGSFIFGWSAVYFQSRRLGLLAAISLPMSIYLAQAAFFNQVGADPAWHAFGWAWLTPVYLVVGYKLLKYENSSIRYSHGLTALRVGLALLFVAAFWPLAAIANDAAAAASSHAVLTGAIIMATLLWRQPRFLYGASMLSFSSVTFAMAELGLTSAQLSIGWATLAIGHIILALNLGARFPIPIPDLATPLVAAGYIIAGLAILPPTFPYHGALLAYILGNWLALAGWGARLAHLKQPGFIGSEIWRKSAFHWLTALPLPVWLWITLDNFHIPRTALPPALAILAWAMLLLSFRLARLRPTYRWPWYLTGLSVSLAAPVIAFATTANGFVPGITLFMVGLLYFADAVINRQSRELAPAGLVTAWGYSFLLARLQLSAGLITLGLVLLVALYFLVGLWVEHKKPSIFVKQFLAPLYLTGHFLTFLIVVGIYLRPLNRIILNIAWTDEVRLWHAASQILLAGLYGVYAWHRGYAKHRGYTKYSGGERWGHLAAWLGAAGLGFIAITYSTVSGSSVALELAFIAITFILIERGLYWVQRHQKYPGDDQNGQSKFIRFTWQLFKRPLLVTGWTISAGVIGLALLYNLGQLGGGRAEQLWASGALVLIAGLYTLAARLFRQVRFVWLAALLSFAPWTILTDSGWFTFANYYDPAIYPFSWGLLAWTLFFVNLSLDRLKCPAYTLPLKAVMHTLLVLALAWSIISFSPDSAVQALGLLAIGMLYLTDAVIHRHSVELAPGGLFTAWGYLLLLARLSVSFDGRGLALAILIIAYILTGLWVEKSRSTIFTHRFLTPLYLTAHALTLSVLWRIYVRISDRVFFGADWSDEMRLWGAAAQLGLSLAYGLYAWGTFRERWGHFAAWLIAMSGGFIAITYSSGSGSAAAKIALAAIIFVLAERGLKHLRRSPGVKRRKRAFIRLSWRLYRHPLLVTGWVISAGTIGLALIRNLLILGGEIREIWAAIALLLITALYVASARLFRQARFLWLAATLVFIPWTILTHLGWFTPYSPTWSGYALSWTLLAWLLLAISLALGRHKLAAYARPLLVMANLYIPFSLIWGLPEVDTCRFTFALAIGFYGLGAIRNYQAVKNSQSEMSISWQTKFFYPALGLIPIWLIYILAWLFPAIRAEHYGLILLVFGPLGMVTGKWLARLAPQQKDSAAYAFPAYLTGYISLAAGTLLAAAESPLLALALLIDAIFMVISTWFFKKSIWLYIASGCAPLSLWLALQTTSLPLSHYDWWLIGLAWIYLVLSWVLGRLRLTVYSRALLAMSFGLIPVGLSLSSLDQTGALWGYGGTAILYGIAAFWLRQPLLLTPATGLAIVPFIISLQKSPLPPEYYGLGLLIGAGLALVTGYRLDKRFGSFQGFPWGRSEHWFAALTDRLLGWWALPMYVAGLGSALASPLLTQFKPGFIAFNFLFMIPIFGWAVYRFQLRIWLVAATLAGHFAAVFYLIETGWWYQSDSARAWLGFLPVTLIMTGVTLFIERYRKEPPLLRADDRLNGWSHLLYIIVIFDIMMGQLLSLNGTSAAALVTVTHAVLIGVLASFWLSSEMVYIGISLGVIALGQQVNASSGSFLKNLAVALAQLALVYGVGGYGLALIRSGLDKSRELRSWLAIWELPLQRFSIGLSLGTLVLTFWLGSVIIIWTLRAVLGVPFQSLVQLGTVQMVVGVLGFLGLLYVAVAFTHRWLRLGYMAIGMLLTAWMLHVFYIQQWDDFRRVQWYALPAGIYLLAIAYIEWRYNNKSFARWLDYTAMVLMLGSLFWQTLLFGWAYALLLGSEGLAAFFWGSSRRLRRFLYAGMSGVILATFGQLLNSLRSINQWIVFGIIGLLLVTIAIIVERKLEDIKAWHEVLETWE